MRGDHLHNGYAVLDFETTGLSPRYGHRIIEIGLVHVDPAGRIERRFETIVNPRRDLGPTHIHRLTGEDMEGAPSFAEIAGRLIDRLQGRVLVAHNARFEMTFLRAELERLGHDLPFPDDGGLCTMRLASEFLPGSGRKLADCCRAYDIELVDAHEALADATATAHLLAAYIGSSNSRRAWDNWGDLAAALPWTVPQRTDALWLPRLRDRAPAPRSVVESATDRLPELVGTEGERAYAAMLDRALADQLLTVDEAGQLHELATTFGLTELDRGKLHAAYFDALVEAVWADGVLDHDERRQVVAVATILGVSAGVLEAALRGTQRKGSAAPAIQVPTSVRNTELRLGPGSVVTLTGTMRRSRETVEDELRSIGATVTQSVTKKTTLLAAADVHSLSGKAQKARQYRIPIVSEVDLDAAITNASRPAALA